MSTQDPRYAKRWRLDRARGELRLVAAHTTALHIATLTGAGWSLRAIAGAAGVSAQSVSRIANGADRVNRATARVILAVDPAQVPSKASAQTTEPFVPRIGAVRGVQALIFMGWPHTEQQRISGVKTASLLNQQGRWITRSSHDRIAAMYRELSHVPGPSRTSRGWAHRLGYVGPTAWEDIDLDPAPELEDAAS